MAEKSEIGLTEPQEEFIFSRKKFPAIVGGMGCLAGDTRIWTERGLIRIDSITSPVRVLSWNETDQKFQLSLCGSAFLKGVDYLHRIELARGEFVSSGHHRSFSSVGKYELAKNLRAGGALYQAPPSLFCSNEESGLKLSLLDVQHYTKTDADCLASYAAEARQYGQQLLTAQGISESYLPSSADACRSRQNYGHDAHEHKDGRKELKQCNSRHYQSRNQKRKRDYSSQCGATASIAEDHILTLLAGRIFRYLPQALQFRLMFVYHHITELFSSHDHSSSHQKLDKDCILKVSVQDHKQPYYDMQVLDTNNYVCEHGYIHHNSGKSFGGTMRLIIKMLENKGANGGYYMPTYDLLRLRAVPGVKADLDRIGIPFTEDKQNSAINISGYGSIIFRSYDNPDRIIAYETAHSIVDELDTLKRDKAAEVWRKVVERNRQNIDGINTIGLVTTPDQGYNGFVYERWGNNPDDDHQLIKAPTASNPFLPDDYLSQIESNYDPTMVRLYTMGEFVSLNMRKVYSFYDRDLNGSDETIQAGDHLHIGLDFNIGGTCAVIFIERENDVLPIPK